MSLPLWALVEVGVAAPSAPGFESVRAAAEVVPNLGRFLERYVGECESDDPEFDRKGCETRVEDFQRKHRGKAIRIEIEDVSDVLELSGFDERRKAFRLHLTPFFAARELAVTFERPKPRGADGLPTVGNLPIWITPPADEPDFIFRRKLERGQVRLELVVVPDGTWAIKRKGGDGHYRGVIARPTGIRVLEARSGKVLVEQTYR